MSNDVIPGLENYKKPTKVKSNKSKIGQVVGTKKMMNPETGEYEDFTLINKTITQDHGFHKVWMEDLINILNSMGNKKMTILSYLLKIMRNSDNTLNFTMRSLSEDTGVSTPTCQSTINELLESNVLKRDSRIKQLYTFNPDLVIKGDSNKRRKILIEYNYEDESLDSKRLRELEKKMENNEVIDTSIVESKD